MKLCPICTTSYPDSHRTCPTHGTVLVDTPELPPGTIIRDCYRIERTLGKGGMGTVYLAEHTLMGEPRALKFLSSALASNPTFVQRFLQEARAASKLRHPNIAATLELGQSEEGSFYISMEYVDGPSLRALITESPQGMAVERAFGIIRGIAEGLGAAHAKRMVHRDIKPENILIATSQTSQWPVEMAKVVDFGIVAINSGGGDGPGQLTQTGRPLLTAEYAAPEQWRGSFPAAELDGRTDLYSLGCMFFEMLTGQLPFHSDSYEGWFEQHVYAAPPAPSFVRPELARYDGLDALLLALLAKDREQRPANAEAFLDQLNAVIARGAGTRNLGREPTRNDLYVGQTGQPPQAGPRRMTVVGAQTAPVPYNPAWSGSQPMPQASAEWQQQSSPQWQPQVSPQFTGNPAGYAAAPAQPAYAQPASAQPGYVQAGLAQPIPPPRPPAPPPARLNLRVLFAVLGIFLLLTIGVVGMFLYLRPVLRPDQPAPQQQVDLPPMAPGDAGPAAPPDAVPSPSQPPVAGKDQGTTPQPTPISRTPAAPTDPVSLAARAITLYNEKEYDQAATLLTQACAAGQADSCDYLGYAYQHKLGVEQDYAKAAVSYDKGCNAGSMAACSHLGAMYLNHVGVVEDNDRAASLYTRACNGGFAEACQTLGSMYQFKKGVAQDFPRAVALYGKACNGGNMAGCDNLGMMYQHNQGVEQDYAKAAVLYGKACDANIADGCNNLGYLYQRKLGVEQDYARAASLYGKACNGGNAFACNNLGIMYQDKEGVELDYAKAATYYGKACTGGSSNGCSDLGELYRKGDGVPKDSEKARTYLSKGCSMGNQWGCDHLKHVQ